MEKFKVNFGNVAVLGKTLTSAGVILLAAIAVSIPAMATDVACVTPNQTLTATAPTIIGTGNGCTSVDSNFQVFNVAGGGGSFPTVATSGSAGIEFPAATGSPLYVLDFETVAQNTSSTQTTCTGQTWCDAGASKTETQDISYFAQATAGQDYHSISLSLGTLTLDTDILAGDVVKVQEMFCIGATSVTVGTGGCTQANSGYLQITETSATTNYTVLDQVCVPGSSSCTLGTVTGSPTFSFNANTEVAVEDILTITTAAGEGRTEFLDSFDNSFNEASPEPSTFLLLGSALVGLGVIRFRKRKQA